MNKYLIVLEYLESEKDLSRVILDNLGTKGYCIQVTLHSFILSSDISAVELRDFLKGVDVGVLSIFVSKIVLPAAWYKSLSENSVIKQFFHE